MLLGNIWKHPKACKQQLAVFRVYNVDLSGLKVESYDLSSPVIMAISTSPPTHARHCHSYARNILAHAVCDWRKIPATTI
jgi:hypothetical protein